MNARDHGGGLDAARTRYGGARADWIDLSTGINPVPYPVSTMPDDVWTALPDSAAEAALIAAARQFWKVPAGAEIVPAAGASALIVRLPALLDRTEVLIPGPTYNEHAAAFRSSGFQVIEQGNAPVQVVVHPNNPDGRLWTAEKLQQQKARLTIIDESFCDADPDTSLIDLTEKPGVIVLKSFGKFWGLAGLRLGFAIASPATLNMAGATAQGRAGLSDLLGPWAVSGPALHIGARALHDPAWADQTRARLRADSARLDQLLTTKGAKIVGGTNLFRLYDVADAAPWQDRLAGAKVWSRIFPYSQRWLRLGLPRPDQWDQLEAAL